MENEQALQVVQDEQEVVAKIMAIAYDEEEEGYVVQFWVGQEFDKNVTLNQAFSLLGNMDALQREIYSFVVRIDNDEFTMEPDERLAMCLEIFDTHDNPNTLGEHVIRQWKTGQVAESIVSHLANANTFGIWRTFGQAVDGPHFNLETETVIEREEPKVSPVDTESKEGIPSDYDLKNNFNSSFNN